MLIKPLLRHLLLVAGAVAHLASTTSLSAREANGLSVSSPLICGNRPSQNQTASLGALDKLLSSGDLMALLSAAALPRQGTPKADLLQGMTASLLLKDEEAAVLLRRYLASDDRTAIFYAASTLAGVEMRRHRYTEAAAALRQALAPDVAAVASERDRLSSERFLPLLEAIKGVDAQSGPSAASGAVAVTRDAANLPVASVSVEGQPQVAILDTGASLSLVVRSRALALGLRLLPEEVSVASPVAEQTSAQLAVANRLEIGGAEFRNVVFLVLPDEALTFAEGRYKIEAIVGFPVLSRLGRVAFSSSGEAEEMAFGPSAPFRVPASEFNLLVDGLTPKVLACLKPQHQSLQLALDSGAQTTSLRPRFASEFPALVTAALKAEDVGGVGGIVSRETRSVPALELAFGAGSSTKLADVSLNEESLNQPGDHGRIGQDILRSKGGYILDFGTMQFSLIDVQD